jgi:hypothetical protein
MAQIGSTRYLERVEFFNGERLFAADLQTLEEFQREMRWLHNQSLHQPGVASGFAVAGAKGDRQVTVQPGYALDSSGREIVLTEVNHIEAVPPVADDGAGNPVTFYLTVSYPATLVESQSLTADCPADPPGAVRLSEVPVFCWVRLNSTASASLLQQVDSGDRILLATAQVLNCQLYQAITLSQRLNAKPGVHPYIFSAQAALPWVKDKVTFQNTQFGIQLRDSTDPNNLKTSFPIDASAAGFCTTPCYFANLIGDRTIDLGNQGGQVTAEPLLGISAPNPAVTQAALTTEFELSLMIPAGLLGDVNLSAVATRLNDLQGQGTLNWTIEWLGVEA